MHIANSRNNSLDQSVRFGLRNPDDLNLNRYVMYVRLF